jgi:hypothetical protein
MASKKCPYTRHLYRGFNPFQTMGQRFEALENIIHSSLNIQTFMGK